MRREIKNIIFDFDGTLADTSRLIVATMQQAIGELNLPYRSADEIKATIGVRLEEIPEILWPEVKGIGESFASVYRRDFEILKHRIPVTLFPGVKETLKRLKESGYRLAIATSRSRKSVEQLTSEFEIKDCFDYILGGNDVKNGKPDPESIFKIIGEMQWNPEETIMVGDMAVDIKMGRNAGIKTCGVTYGNGKESELMEANADKIINSINRIITWTESVTNL